VRRAGRIEHVSHPKILWRRRAGYETTRKDPASPVTFPAPLQTVRDDVLRYIQEKKLDHPVIVGHSLGGFLAFWIAATAPDAVGPLVAVDGVPFLGLPHPAG
jgi:pimeloyl-ACP methyl ester carboxylesterase